MNVKKQILAGAICLAAPGIMLAAPAKRGLRTLTQPDGTTITVNLQGDEFFHQYVTSDGLAVSRGTDGNFYYNSAAGLTSMRANDPGQRDAAEEAFVANRASDISFSGIAKARKAAINARRARRANPAGSLRKASQVPQSGSPRIPIILVQYKDYKFKDTDANATFTDFFVSGNKSAHQYFVDQSNGKYTPQFDVYGPYTLANNRSTYGGNDYEGNDKGVGKMVAEGCQSGNTDIDFSKYDNNGDGECDVVIILYAGDGEASSYDDDAENAVWPCQWELAESDYGSSIKLDNTKINKFAVFNELNGSDLSKIDGIGTFCHEFSHCLDLPDFYDTQYGPHFGMAHWSLLDYGCYNDDGYTPIGYSAYEKEFMGWLDIEEGKEDTFYTLPIFNKKSAATDKAVKLTNPANKNEYFIIENRANQGWDQYMPAEGLLIYHVTYDEQAWINNTVNDYDLQRMTPVPADNNLKINKIEDYFYGTYYEVDEENVKGDLWPFNGNTEFTDNSKPAAKLNLGNAGYLGRPITAISRNDDGSISFWCDKAPLPAVATPTYTTHNILSETSAEFSWTPGDANDVTYTLEVKPHRDITYEKVLSTDFSTASHGWETEGFTEIDKNEHAIRMGSSKQLGGVISPTFQAAEGDNIITVKLSAKSYGNDASSLNIVLLDSKLQTLSEKKISLSSSFDDYTIVLDKAEGVCCVELATVARSKRVYLASAEIFTGDASEAVEAPARAAAEQTRLYEGLTATSHIVNDLTPGGRYDWRVKAVTKTPETMADSRWSETRLLELSGINAVEEIENTLQTEAEYFTLQGIRLNQAPTAQGIYIERRGSKTRKIIVK